MLQDGRRGRRGWEGCEGLANGVFGQRQGFFVRGKLGEARGGTAVCTAWERVMALSELFFQWELAEKLDISFVTQVRADVCVRAACCGAAR